MIRLMVYCLVLAVAFVPLLALALIGLMTRALLRNVANGARWLA